MDTLHLYHTRPKLGNTKTNKTFANIARPDQNRSPAFTIRARPAKYDQRIPP